MGELRALGSARTAGRQVEDMAIGLVGPGRVPRHRRRVLRGGPTVAGQYAHDAARAGALVIDTSSRFRLDDGVPLVVPEVNSRLLEAGEPPDVVASPSSTAVGAGGGPGAARRSRRAFGGSSCRRIRARPARAAAPSSTCRRESIALPPGKSDDDVALRRAFNCVPQVGTVEIDGVTSHERAVVAEVRKILDRPALSLQVTAVRVAMFFGMGASVMVELERPLDRAAAQRRPAERARHCSCTSDGDVVTLPTPADVVGSQATHVAGSGRIRPCRTGSRSGSRSTASRRAPR